VSLYSELTSNSNQNSLLTKKSNFIFRPFIIISLFKSWAKYL